MSLVVANCGMAGAGKSEITKLFENIGFVKIHLGSTEEAIRRYGEATEEKERIVRLELREAFGMGAMAVIAMDKIKKHLSEGKNIIIDNMYSWDEYKIFKKEFGENFITIAIHASPETRYKRLAVREERPRDRETSIKRDYAELEEMDKGSAIAMADYHIVNESSYDMLITTANTIINEIVTQHN
ncbi:MAG: AAA family ATPase [bacterium]